VFRILRTKFTRTLYHVKVKQQALLCGRCRLRTAAYLDLASTTTYSRYAIVLPGCSGRRRPAGGRARHQAAGSSENGSYAAGVSCCGRGGGL
jgi:hypothetical protein